MANKEICRTLSKLTLLKCCLVMVIITQQLSCAIGTKSKDVTLTETNSTLKEPIAESHNRSKRHSHHLWKASTRLPLPDLPNLHKKITIEAISHNPVDNLKEIFDKHIVDGSSHIPESRHHHKTATSSYATPVKYESAGYGSIRVGIPKEPTYNNNKWFKKVPHISNTNKHTKYENSVSTDDGGISQSGLNFNNHQQYYETNAQYANNIAPAQQPLLPDVHALQELHAQTCSKCSPNNFASAHYYGLGASNRYEGNAHSQQSVSFPNQQPTQLYFGFNNPQVTPETVYSHQLVGHAVSKIPSSISLQASYPATNLPSSLNNLHINSQGGFYSGIGSDTLEQNLPLQNENHITAFVGGAGLSQPAQEQTPYYFQEHAPAQYQYNLPAKPTSNEEIVYSHTNQPASHQHTAWSAISNNNDYQQQQQQQQQQSYQLSNANSQQQGELDSQQLSLRPINEGSKQNEQSQSYEHSLNSNYAVVQGPLSLSEQASYQHSATNLPSNLNKFHKHSQTVSSPDIGSHALHKIVYSHTNQPASFAFSAISNNNDYQQQKQQQQHKQQQQSFQLSNANAEQQGELHSQQLSLRPINEGSKQNEQSQSYEHSLNSNYAVVQGPLSLSEQASYQHSATNLPSNLNKFHKHSQTVSSPDIGSHALHKIVYSHTNQPASFAFSAISNNNDYQQQKQQQQHKQQQQSYQLSNANAQQQGELHSQQLSLRPINEGSIQNEQSQSYEHSLHSNQAVVQGPSSPHLRPSYEHPANNSNNEHVISQTLSSSDIKSHVLEQNLPLPPQQLQNENLATANFIKAELSHIQQQENQQHILEGNTNINGNYQAMHNSGILPIDNVSSLNEQNNKVDHNSNLNSQYQPPKSPEGTNNSINSQTYSYSGTSAFHITKKPSVSVQYHGTSQIAQPQQQLGGTHSLQANVDINIGHQQQPNKFKMFEGVANIDNELNGFVKDKDNLIFPNKQKHISLSFTKN